MELALQLRKKIAILHISLLRKKCIFPLDLQPDSLQDSVALVFLKTLKNRFVDCVQHEVYISYKSSMSENI